MKKKAVSTVIASVMAIALVFALVAIVWGVIVPLVKEQLRGAESCSGIFDKVTINNMYTCYNSTSEELQFSINIGDIDVDEVLVSISIQGTTKSYRLTNEEQTIGDLKLYPSGSVSVKLPEKNSGLTYIATGFSSKPDLIKLAPVINGKQCEPTSSLYDIDDCQALI